MKDIENREDVVKLVDTFYENVLKDEQLAPIFGPSEHHWEQHIIRVYNFWENWLFQNWHIHRRHDVGAHGKACNASDDHRTF